MRYERQVDLLCFWFDQIILMIATGAQKNPKSFLFNSGTKNPGFHCKQQYKINV